jgi:hypothetical protein
MVCNKIFLIHVVLWTRLRLSFNACVDPLFDVQVIYRVLTRQQRQDDTSLLLSDQSGSVLGDSTVFSWAGLSQYQRAMNYIFHELIAKIVKIYIDDVVVKSKRLQGTYG